MPIKFTIDYEQREISSIAAGTVTFEDIRDHLLQEQQSQILGYREFVDGRTAIAAFTPEGSRGIVELLRTLSGKTQVGRKAILAPEGYAYGLTRMIEMLTEEFCAVRPFLDEAEARTWLALEKTPE
jgi:hypothetical protein